ncbi:MAG: DUF72 domain-containing protein [Gammaproteobacteria bacterium]|nr:DUF72 domain-containing protein [Gammaproteobacteria bacterium]
MGIRIGTSGWQYRHWRQTFYPRKLTVAEWLGYYAGVFDSVEVNASFYRLPEVDDIRRWCESVPDEFVFAVKAPRGITHFKKLKNCEPQLNALINRLETFGPRLGPVLFQLPPRWRCNPRRLADFLSMLPRKGRFAFEFRDPSWHCTEVYALLKEHRAAFCIFDLDGHTAPLETPGSFAYLRLHGPGAAYTGNYRAQALRTWAGRALNWRRKNKDVFIYFDNDARAYAAKNARRMLALMRAEKEPATAAAAG